MQKKSTNHADEHQSVKRGQHISKHGRRRKGKSEPEVERNPGQLYNRRRWRSDERQKDDREPRDPRQKKVLSDSGYTNIKGTEAKNDAPASAPITARNILVSEEPLNESMNDEMSDVRNDVTGIQADTLPSSERSDKARKRRKTKRHKKSSSDQRRSALRHRKNPFLIDDDALVDDDNFEGEDEQECSPDNLKMRARERKKTLRSSTRRGREPSSTDDDESIVEKIPSLTTRQPTTHQPPTDQPPTHQLPAHLPETNPRLKANTRLRNIPQEYRKRAAALRTRSPTDYMLNGFSKASMRVFEFATGACANAECTYTSRARTESCNRNAPCVTSKLPPILTRGIVNGGCVQPTSQVMDDDPGLIAGPRSFTRS